MDDAISGMTPLENAISSFPIKLYTAKSIKVSPL